MSRTRTFITALGLGALALGTGLILATSAKSETVLTRVPAAAAQPSNSVPSIGSCGIGAQGGGLIGEVSAGGPGALAANGASVGLHVRCLMQLGVISLGAEVSHDWLTGDIKDLGINRDLTVGGSVGVAIVPRTRTYGHAGWSRLDTAFGNIDGWKVGIGNEMQLSNQVTMDLRYTYGVYDVKDLVGPGVDATSHGVRLGLTYNFWAPFR